MNILSYATMNLSSLYIFSLLLSSCSVRFINAFTAKAPIRIHHEPHLHQPNTIPQILVSYNSRQISHDTWHRQHTHRSIPGVGAKSLYEITLFDEEFIEEDELPDELDEDLKHFNDTFMIQSSGRKNFLGRIISQELR